MPADNHDSACLLYCMIFFSRFADVFSDLRASGEQYYFKTRSSRLTLNHILLSTIHESNNYCTVSIHTYSETKTFGIINRIIPFRIYSILPKQTSRWYHCDLIVTWLRAKRDVLTDWRNTRYFSIETVWRARKKRTGWVLTIGGRATAGNRNGFRPETIF